EAGTPPRPELARVRGPRYIRSRPPRCGYRRVHRAHRPARGTRAPLRAPTVDAITPTIHRKWLAADRSADAGPPDESRPAPGIRPQRPEHTTYGRNDRG